MRGDIEHPFKLNLTVCDQDETFNIAGQVVNDEYKEGYIESDDLMMTQSNFLPLRYGPNNTD